jgi:flagellar biosynthetic protein FlhB
MSKQEVKEEFKQTEGDPQIKSKIRQKQRELAKKRMMASVPKADVVITNPTTLAVALMYDRGVMAAPQIVAKGKGVIARKIREIAEEHGVPIIENKPLAWALYETSEIGDEVPENLYRGVAEILAMVYKLKKKAG